MSMMMKLINAAAGQSVGDEIYFVHQHTNTFRLAKIDYDAETITYGTNKSDGTYGEGDTGGNNAHPSTIGGSYSYSGNSNSSLIVADDGYLYAVGSTDLDSTDSDAHGETSILMRWNSKTLEPDPGFFYNFMNDNNNSSASFNAEDLLFHAPSQTISVVGRTVLSTGSTAVGFSIKIFPWPSSGINVSASGIYNSTQNPNGRHLGTFLNPTTYDFSAAAVSYSGSSYNRLHLMSNGKDQLGITTQLGGANGNTSSHMSWKRPYSAYYNGTVPATGAGAQKPTFGGEVINVGSGNFGFEMTSPENPWLDMTGFPMPIDGNGNWKSQQQNASNYGIINIYYRPGRDTAGIHKTPGAYFVQIGTGQFYVFTEGSSKNENMLVQDSNNPLTFRYTLLDSGLLIRGYQRGSSPATGYSDKGVSFVDLDNRGLYQYSNSSTVASSSYATSFQHLPTNVGSEYLTDAKNPNGKSIEKIVQTKSGRIFGILGDETSTQIPPNGGTRIVEIFISEPDVNNFYRRAVSYGESKIFLHTSGMPFLTAAGNHLSTLVGNMPTAKISTANTTAPVKTRFSDVGGAFIQDTPTDAIYIRENTHLYAINPNTRSNITSYDFANQGGSPAPHTIATNIDAAQSYEKSWASESQRAPTGKFIEGSGSTATSLSSSGYGDLQGHTTFDLIYGDDTRLYLALKMDVRKYNSSGAHYYSGMDNSHCLVRFHTGKDGTVIQCGERGPHPSPVDGIRVHSDHSGANYVIDREYYYWGTLENYQSSGGEYMQTTDTYGGNSGMWSGVNLMYDNKRQNVWIVGRRDIDNCNNPDGRTNYSRMVAVPVGLEGAEIHNADFHAWPSHANYYGGQNEPMNAAMDQITVYGAVDNLATSQARDMFDDDGGTGNSDRVWMNSANYNSTDTPNGYERMGVISGHVINVTMNGKTSQQDTFHSTLPKRGSQLYFSGMSHDATQYNSSHGQYPGSNTFQTKTSPLGENRIGAVPCDWQSNGVNTYLFEEPGYGFSNRNHKTAVNSNQDNAFNHLFNARVKLKTNQTTAVTTDNNEEGIRCVWYYKGAFHGVSTFNEGTYVYMPEPEHGAGRDGENNATSPNDNTNTVTHYVSQCESGQNSYNNVIGGSNTKIGTAEGCKNSDWAACVAPGGILCLPKQDSGYAKAGFIGINLGTKSILNTSSGSGQPFEAPSSVNPNNKQIKQMVVTSTGKIWAILDYENPSASTLQFRILQVVFNSNYSSVTWSGGLYTSQASNSNSGHVKFYRTVCGNMPQSKMEWDAV